MAPLWPARLFSSSSNDNSGTNTKRAISRERPNNASSRTQTPFDTAIPPTSPLPPRPRTAGASPMHSHNRSVSQPVPRLFVRKKSTGNLGRSYNEGAVPLDPSLVPIEAYQSAPLDESLVPVLDDRLVDAVPNRTYSGKKQGSSSIDGQITRRCMCCDSKVKIPKELDKFRCMCCMTINDLVPIAAQRAEHASKSKNAKGMNQDYNQAARPLLSVERTRAIIEQCMLTYLESRSRRADAFINHNLATRSLSSRGNAAVVRKPWTDTSALSTSPKETSPVQRDARNHLMPPSAADEIASFMRPSLSPSAGSKERKKSMSRPEIARKPLPPPLRLQDRPPSRDNRQAPAPNTNISQSLPLPKSPRSATDDKQRMRYEQCKLIFRPLEDYMTGAFADHAVLNASFSTLRPMPGGRARSESHIKTPPPELSSGGTMAMVGGLDELDAKTLLLGDIGENGSWWTGKLPRPEVDRQRKQSGSNTRRPVTSKSPNINWNQLAAWYMLVQTAGMDWQQRLDSWKEKNLFSTESIDGMTNTTEIEEDLKQAREHSVRALLKLTENLLKRPGITIKDPSDIRFLLMILANPSLFAADVAWPRGVQQQALSPLDFTQTSSQNHTQSPVSPSKHSKELQHSGILKRAFGLIGNAPENCHRYAVGWLSRLDEEHFVSLIQLCNGFINYRLSRQASQPRPSNALADGGLIPDLSGGARNTSVQLHSAMGLGGNGKKSSNNEGEAVWADDWQIKGAAKVMSLLFAANNIWQGKRKEDGMPRVDSGISNRHDIRPQDKARRSGQLLHTSNFYNSLLDYQDMIPDFKLWESRKSDKFSFCRYPLFLSMGIKIKILEYDARRQMEIKAREAYFDNLVQQQAYLHLKVRRDCMVDDSLRQISQAVGSGQDELKKRLRVHFTGEDGVDAGGLRKEWFLMLVREVFDADHGLFVYDEQSRTCYFNPNTFETSDQYYLIGAVLGLAIYNTTILDIALPSFAFRKLLAAAPTSAAQHASLGNIGNLTGVKGQMSYNLSDLAEFRPALAAGLQQLLDFNGDVESTYCWCFVAPIERYGIVSEVPIVPDGEKIPVTNDNRGEFVDAYVRYLLDTAVSRQFEPFKRGFFSVCGGNALSLFRSEEIELLIRGSDEDLDINSLKAVAIYENWRQTTEPHNPRKSPAEEEQVIEWFWQAFSSATSEDKRKLLAFVTGSDRIPAVGATSLVLRIVAGGDGWSGIDSRGSEAHRFPVARTCFNMIVLWRYTSRQQLEQKLWDAVGNSEGFGLK